MSKQEATRLADSWADCAESGELLPWSGEAAALLRQWPDGESVCYQYLFDSPFGGEVWCDSPNNRNGNKPKASRALYTAPPDSAARIAELEKENANLVRGLREATESPTFMGEPVPDARIAALAEQSKRIATLEQALRFYASGDHFNHSDDDWDTVSGEPPNFWCDDAGTATVEDGTVARMALAGTPLEDERIAELEAEVATLRFQSDALQSAATQLVDLADKRDRLRIEVLILRDSCAAKADRIDRLGETVVRLSATLKVAGEALEALMDPAANEDSQWYKDARDKGRAALQQIKEAQR